MADDFNDNEEQAPLARTAQPSVMKWAIALGVAIFVGMLGALVTAPIVTQMFLAGEDEEVVEDEMVEAEDGIPQQLDYRNLDPALYVPLDPPLLASFETSEGQTRYLQMSIQLMGRKQSAVDAVRTHAPAIRNAFLFLMSNHSYDDVATVAGKEQLRAEMLAEAQAILRQNIGEPGVEEVYFTSLVLQ